MLDIQALPAFSDNYIWLLQDTRSRHCAVVDPGDAGPVIDWLERHAGWQLTDILITHHHADHTGGVPALKEAYGATVHGPHNERIVGVDRRVQGGDRLEILGAAFEVIAVPGHTLDHIAYASVGAGGWLFCGDTLFAGGCGRLFEGTAEQMHASLERLAALPAQTQVFCAHEYTLSNLRFAVAVEPDNPAVVQRLHSVEEKRAAGMITLPSTLESERATNPFLRCDQPAVIVAARRHLDGDTESQVAVFAALRRWKDRF
ncbi:hydroxyacylglutathione hydrolase [Stutzerimonas urumqiensis]|uniref:hydroxyacylglutathione hydrolase n=1 Tax=Stutzerimonas urumqiensis TaxID=638269 RepID=UPI000EB01D30|nr:hydroxyacylglutathione hydrolase [Stutzerimonas urumqiensis]